MRAPRGRRRQGMRFPKPKGKRELLPHARRRALERYGIDLHEQTIDEMARQIKGSRSIQLGRQSTSRSWHVIHHAGRPLLCVYNSKVGAITTFLKWEWLPGALEDGVISLSPQGGNYLISEGRVTPEQVQMALEAAGE